MSGKFREFFFHFLSVSEHFPHFTGEKNSKKICLFVCIVRTRDFAANFGVYFARYIREITVYP